MEVIRTEVKITINGEPKEIADFAKELQNRRVSEEQIKECVNEVITEVLDKDGDDYSLAQL